MKIAVISLTKNGLQISQRITDSLKIYSDITRYSFYKYEDENCMVFTSLKKLTAQIFTQYEALIFISACGIAVRMIAPFIQSKVADPAVIVTDEQGKFVISLLSGHLGGANALTEKIAECICAVPVITTATDIGKKFSPDSFAKANHLSICELNVAKDIASLIVDNQKIGFYSDYRFVNRPNDFFDDDLKTIGICISNDFRKNPFEKTLHLIPKNITLGVGCKKNTDPVIFEKFILEKLKEYQISLLSIGKIVSIDLKENETALNEFSEKYQIPLAFHTAKELMNVQGNFAKSEFVLKTTGTDNVCERSALYDGGKLIVTKQCKNGITLAVGEKEVMIDFERKLL